MQKPTVEITEPKRFGLVGVLASHAVTFLLGIPVIIALAIISLKDLGLFNLLIPLATLAGVLYVLPLLGNVYMGWVAKPIRQGANAAENNLVVQVTFVPRKRTGFRAFIEDADDVGYLRFGEESLIFTGDSMRITLPFDRIKTVQGENVGLRGLYLTAGRITLNVAGLEGVEAVEIAERTSRVVSTSRRITRELFARIKSKVQPV